MWILPPAQCVPLTPNNKLTKESLLSPTKSTLVMIPVERAPVGSDRLASRKAKLVAGSVVPKNKKEKKFKTKKFVSIYMY